MDDDGILRNCASFSFPRSICAHVQLLLTSSFSTNAGVALLILCIPSWPGTRTSFLSSMLRSCVSSGVLQDRAMARCRFQATKSCL
uniref:Uncharacterized protein n=1 Tax=Haemonchus placei TaxID=6290 RepID=A0A0N4WGZ5_HAEPC